jgi:hypothetical protein
MYSSRKQMPAKVRAFLEFYKIKFNWSYPIFNYKIRSTANTVYNVSNECLLVFAI